MTYITTQFGAYSSNNSSSSNVTGGSSYTGTIEEVVNYKSIEIIIFANVASANNGIELQFNQDGGADMDNIIKDTYDGSVQYSRIFPIKGRYFKIKYTNGSTTTTSFRLQTILRTTDGSHAKINAMTSLTNNSSTNLGSTATFTGTGEDVSHFGSVELTIEADQASGSNGIDVQFSDDNAAWATNTTIGQLTYSTLNTQFTRSYKVEKKYYSVIYKYIICTRKI